MSDFREKVEAISSDLLEYLLKRRWYGNKSGKNQKLTVFDAVKVDQFVLAIVEVKSGDVSSMYYTPLYLSMDDLPGKISSIPYRGSSVNVYDAFYFVEFAKFLANGMASERTFRGDGSKIEFVKTKFFEGGSGNNFGTIQTEQSNSSFILDSTIFKNYRYLQFGENPDITMAMNLKNHNFDNVPSMRGYLTYQCALGKLYLCSATEYLPGSVDLWSYYSNLFKGNNTQFESRLIQLASDLGELTGKMATALANIPDEGFKPEPMSVLEFDAVISDAMKYLRISMRIMRERSMTINPVLQKMEITRMQDIVHKLLKGNTMMKIRVHGDYHLGQILLHAGKYFVIDFEGEPARSMDERIRKESPLKDVSGILRSLDYLVSGFYHGNKNIMKRITNSFMQRYMDVIMGTGIISMDSRNISKLLQIFIFQKASYELLYEINNRPSWISIPLESLIKIVKNYNYES